MSFAKTAAFELSFTIMGSELSRWKRARPLLNFTLPRVRSTLRRLQARAEKYRAGGEMGPNLRVPDLVLCMG